MFELSYRGHDVRLRLRPGQVSEEFIELARRPELSEVEDVWLRWLKLEMAERLVDQDANEIYEQVPLAARARLEAAPRHSMDRLARNGGGERAGVP